MGAKLEWDGDDLLLGRKVVLATLLRAHDGWRMLLISVRGSFPCEKSAYERREDCKSDCKSEMLRVLRKAKVDVE